MIEEKFVDEIGRLVGAKREQVSGAVALLDKGATEPFIARYRKDATGSLSEGRLAEIGALNRQFIALTNRREAVLENIAKQGKLTDELRAKIVSCMEHSRLEDLYVPFKKGQRTKGSVAVEHGLGGLADFIWGQSVGSSSLEEFSGTFVDASKSVESVAAALEGAGAILAERIAQDDGARSLLRRKMLESGKVVTVATKNAEGRKTRFEGYYDFSEGLKRISSNHLLTAFQGVRQGFLRMDLVVDEVALLGALKEMFVKDGASPFASLLVGALSDSFGRLLRPMLEAEIMERARGRAEEEVGAAIRRNAFALLMSPPAGAVVVLGVSPSSKGCSVAVVDGGGGLVESASLAFSGEGAGTCAEELVGLLSKHGVGFIAISHGGGPRLASNFINGVLKERSVSGVSMAIVNSAGAAAYGTSALGASEFPEERVSFREAIFTGRRLQNPLGALVKLDPRFIGVGQSQYDVNPRYLRGCLHQTIEMCVSRVGVDVNTAPVEVLRYVSGIQMGTAQNIVAYRAEHGAFISREQLREVAGIGDKTYEQCVGFLRISGGGNPLDGTGIHPEFYAVVGRIAEDSGTSVEGLLGNRALLREVDFSLYAGDGLGDLGLGEIRRELMSSGVDPRGQFRVAKFMEGLAGVGDLAVGMELEGVVTNVTDFGAFLDVGLPQDGLVHLSEMADRFVRDPRSLARIGQIVRVRVVKVDMGSQRVSFSMKLAGKGGTRGSVAGPSSDSARKEGPSSEKPRSRKPRRKPYSKPKPQRKESGGVVGTFGSDKVFGGSMAEQLERFKDRLG